MNFENQVNVEIDYNSVKPQGFDYESRYTKVKIKYNIDIEYRSWGIKGISILAPDQKIHIELELLPEDQEDSQSYTFEVDLSDIKVEADRQFHLYDDIYPQDIQIKIIEIKAKDKHSFTAKATAVLVI